MRLVYVFFLSMTCFLTDATNIQSDARFSADVSTDTNVSVDLQVQKHIKLTIELKKHQTLFLLIRVQVAAVWAKTDLPLPATSYSSSAGIRSHSQANWEVSPTLGLLLGLCLVRHAWNSCPCVKEASLTDVWTSSTGSCLMWRSSDSPHNEFICSESIHGFPPHLYGRLQQPRGGSKPLCEEEQRSHVWRRLFLFRLFLIQLQTARVRAEDRSSVKPKGQRHLQKEDT